MELGWHDEESFGRAAELLDDALPGNGDVRSRLARWYEQTAIPRELVEQALRDAAEELRRLTRERIGLPDGAEHDLEIVTGQRWPGYSKDPGRLPPQASLHLALPLPAS